MSDSNPVLISGATGLIGARLVAALQGQGQPVRALTRRPESAQGLGSGTQVVGWDGRTATAAHVSGCSAVVHLAGEPVFGGRLTASRRARILDSRVETTRSFVEALGQTPQEERPAAFLCASAVGYYGSRGDEPLDEGSASGDGFLADVCRQWEAAARPAEDCGVRVVSLRFGIVLAREGGALAMMALPFRYGLGGRLGDGRQWVPWIHVDDAVGLVLAALRDERYRGPVNVVAPEPARNSELTASLARTLRRPAVIPVPGFALRTALGELSGELLGSRRAIPAVALSHAFPFAHRTLDSALATELA